MKIANITKRRKLYNNKLSPTLFPSYQTLIHYHPKGYKLSYFFNVLLTVLTLTYTYFAELNNLVAYSAMQTGIQVIYVLFSPSPSAVSFLFFAPNSHITKDYTFVLKKRKKRLSSSYANVCNLYK